MLSNYYSLNSRNYLLGLDFVIVSMFLGNIYILDKIDELELLFLFHFSNFSNFLGLIFQYNKKTKNC